MLRWDSPFKLKAQSLRRYTQAAPLNKVENTSFQKSVHGGERRWLSDSSCSVPRGAAPAASVAAPATARGLFAPFVARQFARRAYH